MKYTTAEIHELINDKLERYCACTAKTASDKQMYKAVALVIRDILLKKKQRNNAEFNKKKSKRVYYLCMEFLLGRSLKNNLFNLGLTDSFTQALKEVNFDLNSLYELESDPGLGNGGLGRLAACFMDSLATLDYSAMGFSIRYEYGLFRQKIVDGTQVELPDMWLDSGDVWMIPRTDKTFTVRLGGTVSEKWEDGKLKIYYNGGETVEAMPYDVMISGYESPGASVLRLWRAESKYSFDMKSFTQGDYMNALRSDNEAEIISKVLYPSDEHYAGKQLRLSQQYFLVSASLQSIIADHLKQFGRLGNLHEQAAIHINDTHPALAVPELMRLLLDEYGFSWEEAWHITINTLAYTNHTVMSEALEKWNEELFKARLPRIYSIIKEIDARFCAEHRGVPYEKLSAMTVLGEGSVRMANLAVIGSHSVNGVSELHSEIIKNSVFKNFYSVLPERFTNVTNGIAHRRWLCESNPNLANYIKSLIGEGYITDAQRLTDLKKYYGNKEVLNRLGEIKKQNKYDFARYIANTSGFKLNPESRFDTQIKRLHEYKRQLLNVLKIIKYYLDIKDGAADITPQTFIFGAKAAGGYYHAKRVIQLINCLSAQIQKEPKIKEKLDVMFLENYNVTKAEKLIPASEVSEQISLAGKEASGTSNMKFMLNGALTLGTEDGANVEIHQKVGGENIFIFGQSALEVEDNWRKGYNPSSLYSENAQIKRVVDALKTGFDGESFTDLADYLILGSGYVADPYMCLMDFTSYIDVAGKMDAMYKDKNKWNQTALVNISNAGIFAADRSIEQYAKNIWHITRGNE